MELMGPRAHGGNSGKGVPFTVLWTSTTLSSRSGRYGLGLTVPEWPFKVWLQYRVIVYTIGGLGHISILWVGLGSDMTVASAVKNLSIHEVVECKEYSERC